MEQKRWRPERWPLSAIRLSVEADQVIEKAARLKNVTRSAFIRESALDRARRVIRKSERQQPQVSEWKGPVSIKQPAL